MGRMHSRGKGMSSSALPYKRSPPSWLKIRPEEVRSSLLQRWRRCNLQHPIAVPWQSRERAAQLAASSSHSVAAPTQLMACSSLHHGARLLPEQSWMPCSLCHQLSHLHTARKVGYSVTCIALCTLAVSTTDRTATVHAEIKGPDACRSDGESFRPLAAWAGLSPLLSRPVGVPGERRHLSAADLNSTPWRSSVAGTACTCTGRGAAQARRAACLQLHSAAGDAVAGH